MYMFLFSSISNVSLTVANVWIRSAPLPCTQQPLPYQPAPAQGFSLLKGQWALKAFPGIQESSMSTADNSRGKKKRNLLYISYLHV